MYKHGELTREIIKAAQNVHNTLGYGHNAMALELRKAGFNIASEQPIRIHYDGQVIGEYYADIVVDDKVILEIKALQTIGPVHETQLVNYLKATDIDVGLLLNFGKSLEVKRKIFETARQGT